MNLTKKEISHLQVGQGGRRGQLLHLFQEDPEDKQTYSYSLHIWMGRDFLKACVFLGNLT